MFNHVTVLLNEAVEGLNIKPDGIYVDCTLGGAGHSSLILKQLTTGHLYCFDQDIHAIEAARERLEKIGNQFTIIQSNFKNLKSELHLRGVEHVDGILFDLGVSSPQFDDGARGFSYNYDAPLDMRMNQEASLDAHYIVNHYSYEQLVEILYKYADEKFAKQIARKIEKEREVHPIDTTFQLVDIIKEAIPAYARRKGGHPAKRTFQALRIAVNDELNVFDIALKDALDLLNLNGRISVITFHSLEDKICKYTFNEVSKLKDVPKGLPVIPLEMQPKFKLVNRKPIIASDDELTHNHRAHSAKLRVIERVILWKKRKTGFESFAQVFLIVTIVVFVFGIIMVKSVESSYNRTIQKLQNEIDTLESDIDSLQMQKQELVSFNRVAEVATSKGYTYQNDATASTTGVQQ